MPSHVCLEPGCPTLVPHGRCATHSRQQEQARPNPEARLWYHTARWKRLKAQKKRDNPLCVDCQKHGYITEWTDLDHIIPHRGDPMLFWDTGNVEGRCHSCHSKKTKAGG